jgi:DNA primase
VLEFVSQYVDLKPTASGAIGLCPFHDDHHPSFGVNAEWHPYNCFSMKTQYCWNSGGISLSVYGSIL